MRKVAIFLAAVGLVLAAAALLWGGIGESSQGDSTTTTVVGTGKGLPESPFTGSQDNQNPLLLKEVLSWDDLRRAGSPDNMAWYRSALNKRIAVTWSQVGTYAELGKESNLLGILASNTSLSDEEVQAKAKQDLTAWGYTNIPDLPIIRVNGFTNTRMDPATGEWQEFWDSRSQVRLVLLIPNDPNDLSKGFVVDRGVLAHCGNPWSLPPTAPPGTTSTTSPPGSSTTTSSSSTSTSLAPKDGTKIPPPPPTTPPRSTTTTTVPVVTTTTTGGDSGTGATRTTQTPTTSPPATAPSTTVPRVSTTITF